MPHTPSPSDPYSRRGAAVENGLAVREAQPETAGRDEPDMIEMLLVLARAKKRILQITLAAALGATAIVFLLPNMYTATATILPPQQKQ